MANFSDPWFPSLERWVMKATWHDDDDDDDDGWGSGNQIRPYLLL